MQYGYVNQLTFFFTDDSSYFHTGIIYNGKEVYFGPNQDKAKYIERSDRSLIQGSVSLDFYTLSTEKVLEILFRQANYGPNYVCWDWTIETLKLLIQADSSEQSWYNEIRMEEFIKAKNHHRQLIQANIFTQIYILYRIIVDMV